MAWDGVREGSFVLLLNCVLTRLVSDSLNSFSQRDEAMNSSIVRFCPDRKLFFRIIA